MDTSGNAKPEGQRITPLAHTHLQSSRGGNIIVCENARAIIHRAQNGWVITIPSSEDLADRIEVVEEQGDPKVPEGYGLLNFLIEELGLQGNRRDAQRLYVDFRPGDKHHDAHYTPCSECVCQCDPDQSEEPPPGWGPPLS